jgi:ribosomal protein L32
MARVPREQKSIARSGQRLRSSAKQETRRSAIELHAIKLDPKDS